jgi:hypothetical protein
LKKPISVIDPRVLDQNNNITYFIAKNRRVLLSSTLLKPSSPQDSLPNSSTAQVTKNSNTNVKSHGSSLNLPIPDLWYILQFRKHRCEAAANNLERNNNTTSFDHSHTSSTSHQDSTSFQTHFSSCTCRPSVALCETLPGVLLPVGFRALVADVPTRNTTSKLIGSLSGCQQQQLSKQLTNGSSREIKSNEDNSSNDRGSDKKKSCKMTRSDKYSLPFYFYYFNFFIVIIINMVMEKGQQ